MNEATNHAGRLSALTTYELIRRRIEHEDNLIVQRLSWLVGSQAFLYTAYAIILNGLATLPPGAAPRFVRHEMFLFKLLPLVSIGTCALIYIGILAAVKAMAGLRATYRLSVGSEGSALPGIQVDRTLRRFGLSAPLLLPPFFVAVWLVLWIRG